MLVGLARCSCLGHHGCWINAAAASRLQHQLQRIKSWQAGPAIACQQEVASMLPAVLLYVQPSPWVYS